MLTKSKKTMVITLEIKDESIKILEMGKKQTLALKYVLLNEYKIYKANQIRLTNTLFLLTGLSKKWIPRVRLNTIQFSIFTPV